MDTISLPRIHTITLTMILTVLNHMVQVQATTTTDREDMDTKITQAQEQTIVVPVWLELAVHAAYCKLASDEMI